MSNNNENIIEIKNIVQVFRQGFWLKSIQVLFDVSFSVKKNTILGFVGPNGAGKTTLINLMTGLRSPTSGSIKINGFDSTSTEARFCFGYLPERPYFQDFLTGEQFLHFMGTLSKMNKDKIKENIPKVLEIVGMSHAAKKELKQYSKGMLQRIGIAQAILHDPELVIFDEPMSGLDPLGRKEIRNLIQKLHENGKTVFFTSHIIADVEALSHDVALIQKGKITAFGPTKDFLKDGETLEDHLWGEDLK
jgi:ABC-2 type transport system ATP-binding protein